MGIIDDLENGRWKEERRNRSFLARLARKRRLQVLRRERLRKKSPHKSRSRSKKGPLSIPFPLIVIGGIGSILIAVVVGVMWWLLSSLNWGVFGWWALVVLVVLAVLGGLGWLLSKLAKDPSWKTSKVRKAGITVLKFAGAVLGIILGFWLLGASIDGAASWFWGWNKKPTMVVSAKPMLYSMTLDVTKEWSDSMPVLPGQQFLVERRANAAYQYRIQNGNIYTIPLDPDGVKMSACDRHVWIEEVVTSFQVRLAPEEKLDNVTFDIAWSPYSIGGPCGKVSQPEPPIQKTKTVVAEPLTTTPLFWHMKFEIPPYVPKGLD